MATYADLLKLKDDAALLDKVEVACWVAADDIRNEAPTTPNNANRLIWAAAVFENPRREAFRMLPALLAQNKNLTVAQITGAADSGIQTAVNNSVNLFAKG